MTRVAFVTPYLPWPPDNGGKLRSYYLLRGLASCAEVDLYTDSQYVRGGIMTWMKNWKRNEWRTADKKPVKNADLWKRLDTARERHDVTWHWVRGHSGTHGNERADQLARDGMAPFKPRRSTGLATEA